MNQLFIIALLITLIFHVEVAAFGDGTFSCQTWGGPDRPIVPTWSLDGRLAFACSNQSNYDIYVWDGRVLTNISHNSSTYDHNPTWSADGQLAFLSAGENGHDEVYIWDGTTSTNISQTPDDNESYLLWEDGGRLVFASSREGDCLYMWDGNVINNIVQPPPKEYCFPFAWSTDGQLVVGNPMAEGFRLRLWDDGQITEIPGEFLYDGAAEWSSDGRLALAQYEGDISNVRDRDRQREIMVWDGEQLINVSQSPNTNEMNPIWSHDGRLAFVSINGDLWSGEPSLRVWDGEQLINPALSGGNLANYPTWGNDGRLVFVAYMNGTNEITIWDGTDTFNVSQTSDIDEFEPVWSSDGRLAFYGYPPYGGGRGEIYVWDGTTVTNITQRPDTHDLYPTWSEDGRLAFLSLYETEVEVIVWDGQLITVITDEEH